MIPGIRGICGLSGGALINRYTVTREIVGTTTLSGGTIPASYSAIEIIVQAGPGGGRARSFWFSGQSGAPTPGAAFNATIVRSSGGTNSSSASCNPAVSLYADTASATGGQTNSNSAGTSFRVELNYAP